MTAVVTLAVVAVVLGAGCLVTWMRRRRIRPVLLPPPIPMPYVDRTPEDDLEIIREYFGTWNCRFYGRHYHPMATAVYRRCAGGGWDVFAVWRDGRVVAYRTSPDAFEPTDPRFVVWMWADGHIHETAQQLKALPPYFHAPLVPLPEKFHMPDIRPITFRPGKDA